MKCTGGRARDRPSQLHGKGKKEKFLTSVKFTDKKGKEAGTSFKGENELDRGGKLGIYYPSKKVEGGRVGIEEKRVFYNLLKGKGKRGTFFTPTTKEKGRREASKKKKKGGKKDPHVVDYREKREKQGRPSFLVGGKKKRRNRG